MIPAVKKTCKTIEKTLSPNKAYRKVDETLYVIKQGSTYVMITVVPWEDRLAVVRCVAQVLQGVRMDLGLAVQLLKLNAALRFGAFAYEDETRSLLFLHSILGGETLDPTELLETIRDVAVVADEWDDTLRRRYGGQRMQDLLEEEAMKRVLESSPDELDWDN